MDNNSGKSTSRARGRIAEVLADARASLAEPSRPFTPASLDQRTSLSNIKSLDKYGRIAMTRASAVQGSLLRRSNDGSRFHNHEDYELPSTNKTDRIREANIKLAVGSSRKVSTKTSEVTSSTSSLKNFMNNDILVSVYYLKTILPASNGGNHDGIDNDGLKLFNVTSLKEFCLKAFESVEKIAKFMKTDETNDLKVLKEIVRVIEEIFGFLSDDDKIDNENENEITRKLSCRVVIQLSLAVFGKIEFLNSTSETDPCHINTDFVCAVFLRTMKTMFRYLKIHIDADSPAGHMLEDTYSPIRRIQTRLNNRDGGESDWTTFGDLSEVLGGFVVQNNIDLLLEFQKMLSTLVPNLGLNLISQSDRTPSSSSVGNTSNERDNGISSRKKSASNDDGSAEESMKERQFFILLEISIFSAGILRHHSSDDLNRRKSHHLALMDNIAEELRAIGSFTVACQKQILFNIEKTKNEIISVQTGLKADIFLKKIIEKMSQVVVQLVVVIRNFSLDTNGKTQLINTKMVGLLCSLLKPFKNFPELILNCVRVTAKLSLQDNFRVQINSKPAQIKCLIDVLVFEGKFCRNIMNGNGHKNIPADSFSDIFNVISSIANEKESKKNRDEEKKYRNDESDDSDSENTENWPFWYTWPLISRIAFTLGNLTTSNSANRVLIGVQGGSLMPILSLLQVCGGSLSQIYSGRRDRELQDNDLENLYPDSDREGDGDRDSDDDDEYSKGAMEQELSDATVKLLRLVANLSIEASIGQTLANTPDTLQMLTDLVSCTATARAGGREGDGGSAGEEEELLLNSVAACTNVTFYACNDDRITAESLSECADRTDKDRDGTPPPLSPMRKDKQLVTLSRHLANCLFHDNEEIVLESTRALGNLTRSKAVTRSLLLTRSDEALLLLLAHPNKDIVTAVSGALVNLSGDPGWRVSYQAQSTGIVKSSPFPPLLCVLRRSALKDLGLSILVCQVLHNLLQLDGHKVKAKGHSGKSSPSNCLKIELLTHKIPPLLVSTLHELIDCSDDMTDTLSSLLVPGPDSGVGGGRGVNHVFLMPELRTTNESIKRYLDFSTVGRALLASIQLVEQS